MRRIKAVLSLILTALALTSCAGTMIPPASTQSAGSAAADITGSLPPEADVPQSDSLPFGYDRLSAHQREIYDIFASGVITESSSYSFDAPENYDDVWRALFMFEYERQRTLPISYYAPSYEMVFIEEYLSMGFDRFICGFQLRGIPETGSDTILTGEKAVAGLKLTPVDFSVQPTTKDEYNKMLAEFNEQLPLWMDKLPGEDASDYEKVSAITKLMCENITYDVNSPFNGTPYGAVALGHVICGGYSATFDFFAQKLGLQSLSLQGYITNTDGHEWNMVRVDGKWYHHDVTFADDGAHINYRYFLKSDDTFKQSNHEFSYLGLYTLDKYDASLVEFLTPPEAPEDYVFTFSDVPSGYKTISYKPNAIIKNFDMSYSVENKAYSVSVLIPQKWKDDDKQPGVLLSGHEEDFSLISIGVVAAVVYESDSEIFLDEELPELIYGYNPPEAGADMNRSTTPSGYAYVEFHVPESNMYSIYFRTDTNTVINATLYLADIGVDESAEITENLRNSITLTRS